MTYSFWFQQEKKSPDAHKLTASNETPAGRVPIAIGGVCFMLHRLTERRVSPSSNSHSFDIYQHDVFTPTSHLAADYDPCVILRRVSSDLCRRERSDVLQLCPGVSEGESRVQDDVQSFLRRRTRTRTARQGSEANRLVDVSADVYEQSTRYR